MRKTPWFGKNESPVRPGLYERDYSPARPNSWDFWNGSFWFFVDIEGEPVARSLVLRPWRGLTKATGEQQS